MVIQQSLGLPRPLSKGQLVDLIAKTWAHNTVQTNYKYRPLQESLSTCVELYDDFAEYLDSLPYRQLESIYKEDVGIITQKPKCPKARLEYVTY